MVKVRINDDAADQPDPLPRRRPTACVCDGAAVGPCPGPLNCPYSGLGPEEDESMELVSREMIRYVRFEEDGCRNIQHLARDLEGMLRDGLGGTYDAPVVTGPGIERVRIVIRVEKA